MSRARFARTFALLIGAGLLLSACESMDSFTDKLDIFNMAEKRRLQGERKPVFPEGVPGVSQGIPPDLMKGATPPPDPNPPQIAIAPDPPPAAAQPPKNSKPVVRDRPTRLTVQPERGQPAQDDAPPPAPAQR